MEMSGQLHKLAALPLGKEPPHTHCIGVWVGPRAGLHMVARRKIFSTCQLSILSRPVHSPVTATATRVVAVVK